MALKSTLGVFFGAVLAGAAWAETTVHNIEAGKSHANFVIPMRLLAQTEAYFSSVQGELLRLEDGRMSVEVRIDARALRVRGPRWMDRVSRSPQFLDVQRHPEIRFVSVAFTPALLRSGGPLDGRLRLRGIEKSVQLTLAPLQCAADDGHCDIDVEGEVNRRDFGMSAYRFAVRDAVGVRIRVHLRQDPTR